MFESLLSGLGSFFGSDAFGKFSGGAGSSMFSSLLGNYFGSQQRSDQARLGYEMTDYERAMDFAYAQKYNEANYALARRYAQNSASWAVQGLRRAGINPLLAVTGGLGANMGNPGATSSGGGTAPSQNPNPQTPDIAETMRDLASLDVSKNTAKQLSSQAELNKANENLVDANSAKVRAEADRVRKLTDIEVADLKADIRRKDREYYLSGFDKYQKGTIPAASSMLGEGITEAINQYKRLGNKIDSGINKVYNSAKSLIHTSPKSAVQTSDIHSSAKDVKNTDDEVKSKAKTSYFRRSFELMRSPLR